MKLLHSADLHLDSPMRGLVVYDSAPIDQLRLATRVALGNLVDAAVEEQVDAVLLAGDIFDGDWPHYGTGVHFVSEMGRLREAGIPVVIVTGNHDAESKLTKSLRLPGNVRMLDTRKPQTVTFEDIGLAVHGQGYATPAVLDDLSIGYPAPAAGMLNVGLLHTSADGRPGHERYAPCSVSALAQRGYDYWALGHVHHREVLHADPPIVFPGNVQGRGLRETGPKGATLIELRGDGTISFEHRVLDCVRWDLITVDAAGCADRDAVCERVASAVRQSAGDAGDRLLAARVKIAGMTDAHRALVADVERLRYEVIAAAADVAAQQVWIESVALDTTASHELAHGGDDAVGELIQELEELSGEDGSIGELLAPLAPLADALPASVLANFDPRDAETVRELMAGVSRSLPVALLERAAA
ncbi:MAG: DNA repair exonuclease [Actinomycetota bacterium]|nr:DNA repair exonuclease [Actinomycetota bacterium]